MCKRVMLWSSLLLWAVSGATSNEMVKPGVTRNDGVVKIKVERAARAFQHQQKLSERRQKLSRLWKKFYSHSYSPQIVEWWCSEHERYGIGDLWYASFCNMSYASGLNPRMSCRGGGLWARGLCDCTQLNGTRRDFADIGSTDLLDPRVSIRNHCIELSEKVRHGYRDWEALRAVFLPNSPNGRRAMQEQHRWEREADKFHAELAVHYRQTQIARHAGRPLRVADKLPHGRFGWRATNTGVPPVNIVSSAVLPSVGPR